MLKGCESNLGFAFIPAVLYVFTEPALYCFV